MKATKICLLGVIAVAAGCAMQQPSPYRDVASLLNAPPPQTHEELAQQCTYLRQEIAQQRTVASTAPRVSPGITILSIQDQASRNIAALAAKSASLGCDEAPAAQSKPATLPTPLPVPLPAPIQEKGDYIDLCMAKCKQYTNRTPEQCFDSCK
jgi:hypothetical protein